MSIPQILITEPAKADLDSQPANTARGQPPCLWIAGVRIITPCENLEKATRSAEFLHTLERLARIQRYRVEAHAKVLRRQQVLNEPQTATEEEFAAAVSDEFAEQPRYMVFYHHSDGATQPHTVWAWGSDLITH